MDFEDFLLILFGLILGALFVIIGDGLWGSDVLADYSGLEERLSEEQDRCEARPNVIVCDWDADEATYTPKKES